MHKSILLFSYLASLISQPAPALESERIFPAVTAEYVIPIINPAVTSTSEILAPITISSTATLGEALSVVYTAPQYALPLDWDLIDPAKWSSPHHDYPALDVLTPVGTPVFAIREGKITEASRADGACGGTIMFTTDIGNIMYCHLSQIVVRSGDWVQTGQLVGYSGGRPGAIGAGSSTAPHLHIGLTKNGKTVCIQPLMVSLANGSEPDFSITTRCFK